MGKQIATLVAIVVVAILGGTAVVYWAFPPNETTKPIATAPAVKISMPIDLSGKWESVESKLGTKMVAEVKNNTILVEMYANDGFSGLWYGTFDVLQPGETTISSKALNDPAHFVLSSAETKDFIYQKDSLIFEYKVLGSRTAVEMKRV